MARPDYYPDWATLNTTLPATGKINKQRPKQEIREIGWDKGQIPTAEEFNWQMNNYGLWVRYFQDEVLPTLPTTYLPLNGTRINFTGDLTGNASFIGNSVITANIQVLDNSHLHLSSNISDATYLPTPNTIVKRDANATIQAGDIYSFGTSPNDGATFFLKNFADQPLGALTSSAQAGGELNLYRSNPALNGVTANITLSDGGYCQITRPRSADAQETQPNSLIRYDYLRTEINALNTRVDNLKFSSAFKSNSGWYKDENTGIIFQWTYGRYRGYNDEAPETVNFPIAFPSSCMSVNCGTQLAAESIKADAFGQVMGYDRTSCRVTCQWSGNGDWDVNIRAIIWAVGY